MGRWLPLPLTLVVIGKDRASLEAFDQSACDVATLVSNGAGEPISRLANRHLDNCHTTIFGLCHADVRFGMGALATFAAVALKGSVCGIVGRDLAGDYRCAFQKTRDGRFAGPGPVSTLDGMAVFFRTDLGLRFDEQTFDGMHCHVEDLCLQARARDISIVVPEADAAHIEHIQAPGWVEDYCRYRAALVRKWAGVEFATT